MLRRLCCLILLMLPCLALAAPAAICKPDWPLWDVFKTHLLQDSGRVLDDSDKRQHTTSEGQSYGMFFALVANDKPTFDRLWKWSIDNLAQGDMTQRLPAWLWGKSPTGEWTVLDDNSASDADLWFAYSLLEAGRLWNEPSYTQAADQLLNLIQEQEISELPEFGAMLLPGKDGFAAEQQWILNASYLPLPLLRRIASHSDYPAWKSLPETTVRFLKEVTPKGLSADWNSYLKNGERYSFGVDPDKGPTGSYDAIRTYLWAGISAPQDKLVSESLETLKGMAEVMNKLEMVVPPEKVDTQTAEVQGEGSFGFSAALIPYFLALKEEDQAAWQRERVNVFLRMALQPLRLEREGRPYYDLMLSLFGLGWADQYYKFDAAGYLHTQWEKACQPVGKN